MGCNHYSVKIQVDITAQQGNLPPMIASSHMGTSSSASCCTSYPFPCHCPRKNSRGSAKHTATSVKDSSEAPDFDLAIVAYLGSETLDGTSLSFFLFLSVCVFLYNSDFQRNKSLKKSEFINSHRIKLECYKT